MAGINDVRYYDSEMTGAPAPGLYGAGKMIALLDACLVNGFNLHPVDQIVVSGGVATATTSDEHGFRDYTVIRVVGCAELALNGDWKSDVVAGTTFSWSTTVADGVYGGAMSAKTAPLGWTKEFSGTNVAVYRPKDGVRHYFRFDDNNVSHPALAGFVGKTDASNAGVGRFPLSGICNFGKTFSNDATGWFVVGDGACVYLISSPEATAAPFIRGFGEFLSFIPGDTGGSFVSGANQENSAILYGWGWDGLNFLSGGFSGLHLCQSSGGAGPVAARLAGGGFLNGWGSSTGVLLVGLNPADSSVLFHHPVHIQEDATFSVRGEMPGLWQPINQVVSKINSVEIVDGRRVLIRRVADVSKRDTGAIGGGMIGIDITGPWR